MRNFGDAMENFWNRNKGQSYSVQAAAGQRMFFVLSPHAEKQQHRAVGLYTVHTFSAAADRSAAPRAWEKRCYSPSVNLPRVDRRYNFLKLTWHNRFVPLAENQEFFFE